MSLQRLFDNDHCVIFSVRERFVPKTNAQIPNFRTLLKLMYLVKWHRCMALLYKDVMLDHANKLSGVYTCIGNLWSLHIWYLRWCFWWYIICYVDANNLDICLFYWLFFFSEFFVDLLNFPIFLQWCASIKFSQRKNDCYMSACQFRRSEEHLHLIISLPVVPNIAMLCV